MLKKLQQKHLPVKLSKCEFYKHKIAFLSYLVSEKGLALDPVKIQSIEEWPRPQNIKEVQLFVGLANYYRKFILGYSHTTTPLTNLTKKDQHFNWTEEYKQAFKAIKEKITKAPILAIFNLEKEAILKTDTSDYTVGTCLT